MRKAVKAETWLIPVTLLEFECALRKQIDQRHENSLRANRWQQCEEKLARKGN
jgi:hypothetical protein